MSTAAAAHADDGWGDTPGTYTHYEFPTGTSDLSSVTWSTTGTATRPANNGDCADVTSTIGPDGGEQILGIGNSARGAVTDRAGRRLDVDGVDFAQLEWAEDADPAAAENRAAGVETCHRRTDQGWVRGADRTLRPVNNFCLTAAPETPGNGKKVPVTITTCAAGHPGAADDLDVRRTRLDRQRRDRPVPGHAGRSRARTPCGAARLHRQGGPAVDRATQLILRGGVPAGRTGVTVTQR